MLKERILDFFSISGFKIIAQLDAEQERYQRRKQKDAVGNEIMDAAFSQKSEYDEDEDESEYDSESVNSEEDPQSAKHSTYDSESEYYEEEESEYEEESEEEEDGEEESEQDEESKSDRNTQSNQNLKVGPSGQLQLDSQSVKTGRITKSSKKGGSSKASSRVTKSKRSKKKKKKETIVSEQGIQSEDRQNTQKVPSEFKSN